MMFAFVSNLTSTHVSGKCTTALIGLFSPVLLPSNTTAGCVCVWIRSSVEHRVLPARLSLRISVHLSPAAEDEGRASVQEKDQDGDKFPTRLFSEPDPEIADEKKIYRAVRKKPSPATYHNNAGGE